MKLRYVFGSFALVIILASAASAQLATRENPFPETGRREDSAVFDTDKQLVLKGVITQQVSRSGQSPSYLFFRIQVRKQEGGASTWTIRIYDPQLSNLAKNCRFCLVNDYTPEMERLKVGMTVTVQGYQSKKGGNRLSLVPAAGPATTAGIIVH